MYQNLAVHIIFHHHIKLVSFSILATCCKYTSIIRFWIVLPHVILSLFFLIVLKGKYMQTFVLLFYQILKMGPLALYRPILYPIGLTVVKVT